jgi:hypothetical protein
MPTLTGRLKQIPDQIVSVHRVNLETGEVELLQGTQSAHLTILWLIWMAALRVAFPHRWLCHVRRGQARVVTGDDTPPPVSVVYAICVWMRSVWGGPGWVRVLARGDVLPSVQQIEICLSRVAPNILTASNPHVERLMYEYIPYIDCRLTAAQATTLAGILYNAKTSPEDDNLTLRYITYDGSIVSLTLSSDDAVSWDHRPDVDDLD